MSTTTSVSQSATPGGASNASEWIAHIQGQDAAVRAQGCTEAAGLGAAAIPGLADVLANGSLEVSRTAKRALWSIVYHAGRPDGAPERELVNRELVRLLESRPAIVRSEVLWMLSVIGSDDAVPALARSLQDAQVREDARCSLERIPGEKATKALQTALSEVPEEFRAAVAHSLRVRGIQVSGYAEPRLAPIQAR